MKKIVNLIVVVVLFLGVIRLIASSKLIHENFADGDVQVTSIMKTLDVSKVEVENVKYSELFSKVNFIPLEAVKNALIGNVSSVEIHNDTLYVFDKSVAKALFLFTVKGKFVRRIGKQGKGPGEYFFPQEFYINQADRTVSFYDRYSNKIVKYSIDGKHIKDIPLQGKYPGIFFAETSKYIYTASTSDFTYSHSQFSLLSHSNNGKAIKRWFNSSYFNKGWSSDISPSRRAFFNKESELIFWSYFCDTIYSIRNNSVYPYIAVNSDVPLTHNDISEVSKKYKRSDPRILHEIRDANKYFGISDYMENNQMIYFTYCNGWRQFDILYDKKKGSFVKASLKDDMTGLLGSAFEHCNDKWFVKYLNYPNAVEELRKNAKNKAFTQYWVNSNVLIRRDLEQNPVVLLYEIK